MTRTRLPFILAALVVAAADGRAGCLAPSDTAIDAGTGSGPLAGNDAGSLVYVRRGLSGHPSFTFRTSAGLVEDVAVEGDANEFRVGTAGERWDVFHTAAVNQDGDLAFIASTKLPDDPLTPANEAVSRRGVYARSGRQLFRIARFGEPSPVRDAFGAPVPWGTVFDATAADPDASGFLRVVFSGQLAGDADQRLGLFRWSEAASATVTPALLAGDAAPSGGSFSSFGRVRGNGPGDVVFFAVTKLTDASPPVPGLFLLRSDGTRARIVKFGTEGDAAPGGGAFGIAGDFDVDGAGVVYFAATLEAAPKPTALFRAQPPLFAPEPLFGEGDATPIAGTFGSFARGSVRANASGELALSVPLSDEVGGDGIFTLPAGASAPLPLVAVEDAIAVAAIGSGRAGYSSPTSIRVVVPSDGSVAGPTDFRVLKLDVRNSVPLRTDTIRFDGRFLLPPWGTAPPAAFRGDATRFTTSQALTGAQLTKIVEVKVSVSSSPGNNFICGIGGTDAAPTGSVKFNGQAQDLKSLNVSSDGGAATWKFSGAPGPVTFSVDLAAGTFSLKVSRASIQPSYEASNFRVAFVLRSADDVAQARPDDQSFFRRDMRIAADQPSFGKGRRVTSKGEGAPGGTVFVDALRVTRRPATGSGAASDSVQMSGTLRLCPGSSAPATPRLPATLHLGDFVLDAVEMTRVGNSANYRYAADGIDFRLDLDKATFSLKVKSSPPLAALADAVPGSVTNGPEHAVGGMQLAFTLSVPRVYEASFPIPIVRLAGGKVFQR